MLKESMSLMFDVAELSKYSFWFQSSVSSNMPFAWLEWDYINVVYLPDNNDSGNVLLPDVTKPIPELMLTCRQ